MMFNSSSTTTRNRSPFTPTQWQELEHQALIYKYMVSGVPIPPELIYSIKRSLDSSLASRLFPHQSLGWGCLQVGFNRKADPEPGRCRRTDGKKWRCSKEAYPDSKYCERHMHRGRNRSRKPVELSSSSSSTTTSSISTSTIPISSSSSSSSSSSQSINRNPYTTTISTPNSYTFSHNPFLYNHSSSSSRPINSGFSSQNNPTHNLFLDSGSSSSSSHADKGYRYFHGLREEMDERTFFPEASSGSIRGLQDSFQPLNTSSYKGYTQSELENLADASNQEHDHQQQQQQHCLVLGTDFKPLATTPIKFEKEAESQKPLHLFFNEWPPKNSDS